MNRIALFLFFTFLGSPLLAQRPSSTDEEPTPTKSASSGNLMWILPTILALGAGGYAWFVGEAVKRRGRQLEGYIKQVSSRQKKSAGGAQSSAQTVVAPVVKDDRMVQALEKRVGSLEKELDELRAELKRRTRAPQQPVQAQSAPQPQPPARPQPAAQSLQSPTQPMPSIMATVNKATAPAAAAGPQTKWAKYADAGDGFNASSLSDEQDSEKLFELSVDGVSGSFRVVSALPAQQMALHDPTFYLAKACTYDTLPTQQSTITTETPGTLRLVGGKWVIQQPAKIRFS